VVSATREQIEQRILQLRQQAITVQTQFRQRTAVNLTSSP
jgi:hypothetical protein